MLIRFRLLLVWLVLAAIPLQGLAAASMLFCGVGSSQLVQAQAQPSQADPGGGGYHRHASSGPAGEEQAQKTAGTGSALPEAAHECAVCASCSHGVAITDSPPSRAFAQVTQAEAAEPFVLIQPRPSQVLDRPPRS